MSKATEWVARRHAVQAERPEFHLAGVRRAMVGEDGQLVVEGWIPDTAVRAFIAWVWDTFGGDDISQADLARLGQVAWETGASSHPRGPRAVGEAVVRVGGG